MVFCGEFVVKRVVNRGSWMVILSSQKLAASLNFSVENVRNFVRGAGA
jgi:hypothetical protein